MTKKQFAKTIESVSAVLTGTYLLASFPGFKKKKKWQHLLRWDYAHRGLHQASKGIPENSLAAFGRAVDHHYGIELDVRLTRDKKLVIFHDDNLKRMCGLDRKVIDMTYDELCALRLSGTDKKIPLFSEVLDLVGGKVPLIVELKDESKGSYAALCRLVCGQLSSYRGYYCIESFHPGIVMWFRKHHPEIIRGQLSCRPPKDAPINHLVFLLLTHLLTNFVTRPDFIAYQCQDIMIPAYWINRHLFRIMTVLWTIRSRKEYNHYRGKADLMIFENFTP